MKNSMICIKNKCMTVHPWHSLPSQPSLVPSCTPLGRAGGGGPLLTEHDPCSTTALEVIFSNVLGSVKL